MKKKLVSLTSLIPEIFSTGMLDEKKLTQAYMSGYIKSKKATAIANAFKSGKLDQELLNQAHLKGILDKNTIIQIKKHYNPPLGILTMSDTSKVQKSVIYQRKHSVDNMKRYELPIKNMPGKETSEREEKAINDINSIFSLFRDHIIKTIPNDILDDPKIKPLYETLTPKFNMIEIEILKIRKNYSEKGFENLISYLRDTLQKRMENFKKCKSIKDAKRFFEKLELDNDFNRQKFTYLVSLYK